MRRRVLVESAQLKKRQHDVPLGVHGDPERPHDGLGFDERDDTGRTHFLVQPGDGLDLLLQREAQINP